MKIHDHLKEHNNKLLHTIFEYAKDYEHELKLVNITPVLSELTDKQMIYLIAFVNMKIAMEINTTINLFIWREV